MAKAKTHDFKGRVYVEIPKDIVKLLGIDPGDEVFFKNVYEDLVIILKAEKSEEEKPAKPAPTPASKEKEVKLSDEDIGVLKKIGYIRHYERTMKNIDERLNDVEKKICVSLLSKKVLFEYTKRGKRLIGISREYFPYVVGKQKMVSDPLVTKLMDRGYMVLDDYREAMDLNNKLRRARLDNKIRGVRGFDKKYYVITTDKLSEVQSKFSNALKTQKTLEELAGETRLPEELCKAALEVLRESGEIVEKKKEVYVMT